MFIRISVWFEYRDYFCGFPGVWDSVCIDYFVEKICNDGDGVVGEMFHMDWGDIVWAKGF